MGGEISLLHRKGANQIESPGFREGLGFVPVPNSHQKQPVGGRLSLFLDGWKKVTSDRWILSIVQQGLKLSFISTPEQEGIKITKFNSVKQNEVVLEEVKELLRKQAIETVPDSQIGTGYYSTFFMVPKKDGGFRPILNLKRLNMNLQVPHFKMETFQNIRQSLEVGDWVITIDLEDAYSIFLFTQSTGDF